MNNRNKIVLGLFIFIGAAIISNKKSIKSKYKQDDINLLLPSFRNKIEQLLNNMRKRGFDPILFDTYRTPEEAEKNVAKGTGIKLTMHGLKAATDIISASKGWNYPEFFKALGQESNLLNLTWGGDFRYKDPKKKPDLNHVQAIPVKLQPAFRKLTSESARDTFINSYYASLETNPRIS